MPATTLSVIGAVVELLGCVAGDFDGAEEEEQGAVNGAASNSRGNRGKEIGCGGVSDGVWAAARGEGGTTATRVSHRQQIR
uniref:Secreted protein n=1 Tax=Asparagus officinalis TaxID=4686 RepID=Q2AAA1_ASPOF|nr:hypothetical protein 17.t00022 [Asparagus officinalis]